VNALEVLETRMLRRYTMAESPIANDRGSTLFLDFEGLD
jgi:hypothetical protein